MEFHGVGVQHVGDGSALPVRGRGFGRGRLRRRRFGRRRFRRRGFGRGRLRRRGFGRHCLRGNRLRRNRLRRNRLRRNRLRRRCLRRDRLRGNCLRRRCLRRDRFRGRCLGGGLGGGLAVRVVGEGGFDGEGQGDGHRKDNDVEPPFFENIHKNHPRNPIIAGRGGGVKKKCQITAARGGPEKRITVSARARDPASWAERTMGTPRARRCSMIAAAFSASTPVKGSSRRRSRFPAA